LLQARFLPIYIGWMTTVDDSSQTVNDAISSNETIVDDPSLFDTNSNTLVPITKLSTDTFR